MMQLNIDTGSIIRNVAMLQTMQLKKVLRFALMEILKMIKTLLVKKMFQRRKDSRGVHLKL